MSYLLAIFPPDRDISPIIECYKQYGVAFQVKSTFEGLAPFAENYAIQQRTNAKIKGEIEPVPGVTAHAVAVESISDSLIFGKRKPGHRVLNAHMLLSDEYSVKEEVEDENIEEEVGFPSDQRNDTIPQRAYGLMGGDGGNADGEWDDSTHGAEEGDQEDVDMDESMEKYNVKMNKETNCPVDGCSQKPLSYKDLLKHMRKHMMLICGICKRSFPKPSQLHRHYRTHTGEKAFKCDICSKGFVASASLKSHRLTHTGEKPYHCSFCEKSFAHSSSFTIHKRTHTGLRPFECDVCDYKAADCTSLKKHKRTHTGEKPYSCTVCAYRAARADHLTQHKKRYGH